MSDAARKVILGTMLLATLALAACDREERDYRPDPAAERGKGAIVVSGGLYAGPSSPPSDDAYPEYTENAYHVAEGKRLFQWFNCVGCHSNGGGGMGPPLMDDQWIYGNAPANIYATITEGRPNGMPSFRQKIPEPQVWQLVAYVRSMSGLVRKDVAPGRNDDMNARPAEQSVSPLLQPPPPGAVPAPGDQPPASTGTR